MSPFLAWVPQNTFLLYWATCSPLLGNILGWVRTDLMSCDDTPPYIWPCDRVCRIFLDLAPLVLSGTMRQMSQRMVSSPVTELVPGKTEYLWCLECVSIRRMVGGRTGSGVEVPIVAHWVSCVWFITATAAIIHSYLIPKQPREGDRSLRIITTSVSDRL